MKPTSTFETITPHKAQIMLNQNKNNRPVNEANLNNLIQEMKRNNFHCTGESIKIAKNGNLLDGQHRLFAIVKTGMSYEILVVRGLDDDSFKYIDTGRTRKASDVLGIEGVKNPVKISAMIKFIINFQRGFFSAASNRTGSRNRERVTNAMISEFYAKHSVRLIDSYPAGINKQNKLLPGTILSSFHFIFEKIDSDSADDFCHKLSTGENLTKESPIYLLRQKMTQDIRSTRKIPSTEKSALICKAWNLYRKNKKVSILKWDSLKEPFPKPI